MKKKIAGKRLFNFQGKLVKVDVTRQMCNLCGGVFQDVFTITELEDADKHHQHLSIIPIIKTDTQFTLLTDDLHEYMLIAGHDITTPYDDVKKGQEILVVVGELIESEITTGFTGAGEDGFIAATVTIDSFDVVSYFGDGQDVIYPHEHVVMIDICDHCWDMTESLPESGWSSSPVTFHDWNSIIMVNTPMGVFYYQFDGKRWNNYKPKVASISFMVHTSNIERQILPFVVGHHLSGAGVGYICPNRLYQMNDFAVDNITNIEALLDHSSTSDIVLHLRKIISCSEEEKIIRRRCEEVLRKQPAVMYRIAALLANEGRIKLNDL